MLVICMSISFVPVFAKDNMDSALLSVKTKVSIPEELSEFTGSVNKNKNRTEYMFMWQNKEKNKEISVTCNTEGVIRNYSYYSEDMYLKSPKKLPSINKTEAIRIAEDFIRKVLPESL